MTEKEEVILEPGKLANVIFRKTDENGNEAVVSDHAVEMMELYMLSHSVNVRILGLMIYEEDKKVYFFDDHDEIASRTASAFE